jgi:hypothetical protein
MILRNVLSGILPHHYTVSPPRKSQLHLHCRENNKKKSHKASTFSVSHFRQFLIVLQPVLSECVSSPPPG